MALSDSQNLNEIGCCVAAMLIVSFATIPSRSPVRDPGRSILRGAAVEYLYPEQVTVPAGKPSPVAMHFRVGEGLHVNSHTPSQDYLIPTMLSIPESSGVRLEGATYPAGSDFTLPLDPVPSSASIPASSPSIRTSSPRPATTSSRPNCATRPATKTPACLPRPSPSPSMWSGSRDRNNHGPPLNRLCRPERSSSASSVNCAVEAT